MYNLKIETPKGEYQLDAISTTHGIRVTVWFWDNARKELDKVSQNLHPLATDFESLWTTCIDLFGENFDADKMAYENEIPIRFADDAECEKCGTWSHYSEMVFLGGFDYLCQDCHYKTTAPDFEQTPIAGI